MVCSVLEAYTGVDAQYVFTQQITPVQLRALYTWQPYCHIQMEYVMNARVSTPQAHAAAWRLVSNFAVHGKDLLLELCGANDRVQVLSCTDCNIGRNVPKWYINGHL